MDGCQWREAPDDGTLNAKCREATPVLNSQISILNSALLMGRECENMRLRTPLPSSPFSFQQKSDPCRSLFFISYPIHDIQQILITFHLMIHDLAGRHLVEKFFGTFDFRFLNRAQIEAGEAVFDDFINTAQPLPLPLLSDV